MDYLNIYFGVGLLVGLSVFCSIREHLLSMLLSLEFMVLMIFSFMLLGFMGYLHYYALFYLIMTVCEGSLGLSVMVVMGRAYGGDYFSGLGVI